MTENDFETSDQTGQGATVAADKAQPMFRDKEILNIEEAAAFLTISPAYLYRLINEGAVPCARLGKRAVFVRSALLDWVLEQVGYSPKAAAKVHA